MSHIPFYPRSVAAGSGRPGGGYAEPKPDRKRGDDAEDAFTPEYDQGRQTREDRDNDDKPVPRPSEKADQSKAK